jgi:hypothetical protein
MYDNQVNGDPINFQTNEGIDLELKGRNQF